MSRLLFRNARLIDGQGPPRTGACVAVEGERITAVGDAEGVEARRDDRVADLAGRTLMPGMVQAHFHSTFANWGAGAPQLGLERPAPVLTSYQSPDLRKKPWPSNLKRFGSSRLLAVPMHSSASWCSWSPSFR